MSLILESKFPHFIAWGPDLVLLFNDAYAALLEKPEEALGAGIEDYWAHAWATVGPIARAAMGGTSSFFEDLPMRLTRGGRSWQTWWTFAYSPIRLADGNVGGIFGTATETTHHRVLERRLEEGERALRRFTDLVPNFLWESDAQGKLTYMNREMIAFTGHPGADERPNWSLFVHPEDIAKVVSAYADAVERQTEFECEHRFRAADGSYRWFLARARPLFDESGEGIAGWYGCATDIQNWRLAVEEMRQSEQLTRSFAENAARIFWIADSTTGKVEFLNAAGRRFWDGGPERSIRGWEDWLGAIHPDSQTAVINAMDRLRDGETVVDTFRVADGQRNYCDLRVTLFPLTQGDGKAAKFGGIAEVVARARRRLIHLVDPDREGHRLLSAQLWAAGYEVRGFTDVHAFARVAPALLPGCVLVRAVAHTAWVNRVVTAAQQRRGKLPVVVMSDRHRDADHIRALMKAGASDVVPHDIDWDILTTVIDDAAHGLDDPESALGEPARQSGQKLATLSLREREILNRLIAGSTNKVVAIDLGISPRTVEAHRARIFEKLGVSSLAEAVAMTVTVISE